MNQKLPLLPSRPGGVDNLSLRGKDVFVHISKLNGETLAEGQQVTFETQEGRKGPEAINIEVL